MTSPKIIISITRDNRAITGNKIVSLFDIDDLLALSHLYQESGSSVMPTTIVHSVHTQRTKLAIIFDNAVFLSLRSNTSMKCQWFVRYCYSQMFKESTTKHYQNKNRYDGNILKPSVRAAHQEKRYVDCKSKHAVGDPNGNQLRQRGYTIY